MSQSESLLVSAKKIREIEEKIVQIYPSDLIQSPLHLSIGQEAVAVGICSNLKVEDQVFTTYRSHAYYLAKGGNLNEFFSELMGRSNGCCKGKGGSMHLADSRVNFMGTSAIVASTIPHSVGSAYANKFLRKPSLVICVIGDGAADAGIFHESLNFASLNKLKIIFVVEDNDLAVHTKKSERQSFKITKLAEAYGLNTYELMDSRDPFVVYDFFKPIYSSVSLHSRPALALIKTFRYKEHVGIGEDFNAGYRDKREFDNWLKGDPLNFYEFDSEKIKIIREEIDAAISFAENSPFPTVTDLYTDVM